MKEKLNWDDIKKQYAGEWIELIDYDWPDGIPWPRSGVVRVHAPTRQAFYRLANNDPPQDSAILFVGQTELPENVYKNNLMKITVCD